MSEELTFNMPRGMVEVLSRYHSGNQEVSNENRAKGWFLMQKLNDDYKKYKEKENNLLFVEWDEKKIEEHFQEPIWYNAHAKLKKYRQRILDNHKKMFFLLTRFDKINSPFIQGEVISTEEIYLDFKNKYVNKIKEVSHKFACKK